jgi:hypothetical protein
VVIPLAKILQRSWRTSRHPVAIGATIKAPTASIISAVIAMGIQLIMLFSSLEIKPHSRGPPAEQADRFFSIPHRPDFLTPEA